MPLKVIDKTGRLPKNPKDWPAELKRAIAECCCADESSSSSSSPGGRKTACCPNTSLPDVINATISGGTAIDGSYALTWNETDQQWRTPFIFQFSCFLGLSLHSFYFRLSFNMFCGFLWEQVDDRLSDGTIIDPSGSMTAMTINCGHTLSCDPFYFAAGLVALGGFPPRKVCNGFVNESNNTCTPPSGPFVEVTL